MLEELQNKPGFAGASRADQGGYRDWSFRAEPILKEAKVPFAPDERDRLERGIEYVYLATGPLRRRAPTSISLRCGIPTWTWMFSPIAWTMTLWLPDWDACCLLTAIFRKLSIGGKNILRIALLLAHSGGFRTGSGLQLRVPQTRADTCSKSPCQPPRRSSCRAECGSRCRAR